MTAATESVRVDAQVEVMPNPASDILTIRSNAFRGAVRLSLLDQSGKRILMLDTVVSGELRQELDVQGLPAGLYLLQVTDRQYVATKKVVIAR